MRRWKLATWRFLATLTREESGNPTAESLTRVGLARAGEAPGEAPGDGTGRPFQAAKRSKKSGRAWRGRWSPAEPPACFWRPKQQHTCLMTGII